MIQGAGAVVAALPGALLAAGLGATAVIRQGKPLHPVGTVGDGQLHLTGGTLGVPFLDTEDVYAVRARFSWATGNGPRGADVHGLAVRLTVAGEPVDWLFASTGSEGLTRFALTRREPGAYGTLTTLLPVRTAAGPLLLRAEPADGGVDDHPPARHTLFAAIGTAEWTPIGSLTVEWGPDEEIRFEPIQHLPPGCSQYPAVVAVREPSYVAARLLGHR